VGAEKNYDSLFQKYQELELRVTQFSGVEQELINTRDKLDHELVLYKRLNDFNQMALKELSDNSFAELVGESLIDILELESGMVFFYCPQNDIKVILACEGCCFDEDAKKIELKDYFDRKLYDSSGKTLIFNKKSSNVPSIDCEVQDGLFFSQIDRESGGGVLVMSWVTEGSAPLYKQISSREKNVFSIFAQQVFSLFINRLKTDKIQNQIEQISQSQLELKKLSLIATKTKNGVIISNKWGEVEWVNDAFVTITGYSLDDVKGKKPKDFLQNENSAQEKISLLREKLANKEQVEVTLINKTKSNSLYYNQLEVIPIFDDAGNHINFIALQRDITNEVESKEEILRINSRYQLIADNAEIGIWEFNAKNNQVNWNEVLYRQYGIVKGVEKDLYSAWLDAIHPEDKEYAVLISDRVNSGELFKAEMNYRIIQKNSGEIRHLKCLLLAERDEQGNLIRLVGSATDQTEEVEYLMQIEDGKKKIEKINLELEKMVQVKTQRNMELAKTISDQEKLVTIGEIASGIAHDLNTPIGSIKVGAESVRSTLENLFKQTLKVCTFEQLDFACNRAMNNTFELFVGGLQKRREMKEFSVFLENTYAINKPSIELLEALVRCRFKPVKSAELDFVLSTENNIHFFQLIYEVQSIRSFIDTILASSERTAKVVQDMRSYIHDNPSDQKALVDLRSNIATVITIFNYEIKRKTDLIFQVDEGVSILGFDIHLFQLWSNLLKNAIESFDKEYNGNYIKIWSEQNDRQVMIHVENNGPMIPLEIQGKIFEKFYSTKKAKNGTGLGLSIVKKIVDEHNAKIQLYSDENRTTFTLIFPKKINSWQ
jgi:PAS domain S-box-containing protein